MQTTDKGIPKMKMTYTQLNQWYLWVFSPHDALFEYFFLLFQSFDYLLWFSILYFYGMCVHIRVCLHAYLFLMVFSFLFNCFFICLSFVLPVCFLEGEKESVELDKWVGWEDLKGEDRRQTAIRIWSVKNYFQLKSNNKHHQKLQSGFVPLSQEKKLPSLLSEACGIMKLCIPWDQQESISSSFCKYI